MNRTRTTGRHTDADPTGGRCVARPTSASRLLLNAGVTPVVHEYGSLGCSGDGFNRTDYNKDQAHVHELMNIDQEEMDYFNQQFALTLLSFGISREDLEGTVIPFLGLFQRGADALRLLGLDTPQDCNHRRSRQPRSHVHLKLLPIVARPRAAASSSSVVNVPPHATTACAYSVHSELAPTR